MTAPTIITKHALERVALRWGVDEPAMAEWMIHECIRLGVARPRDDGTIQHRYDLPNGFTRIVIMRHNRVVSVANHRKAVFVNAQKKKRESIARYKAGQR